MASFASARAVCLLLISLALCQTVAVQATPTQQIVAAFRGITDMSDKLRIQTEQINDPISALLDGYKIGFGFSQITFQVGKATSMIAAMPTRSLGDADAKLVVNALTTFVRVHQALLNVVIGKHGLLALIPFFEPIRLALVSLERAVDSFAFALIAVIPTEKPAADKQFSLLRGTVGVAITTYDPANTLPV